MVIDAKKHKIKLFDIDYLNPPLDKFLFLTVFGKVPCGKPNYIDDDREGYLQIPVQLIGDGDYFVLRAKGDSMVDAEIFDSDLVIVKQQSFAEDGQIVVARINENVTLKRYFKQIENKTHILHPENELHKDIIVKECDIIGIVVKIIKNI